MRRRLRPLVLGSAVSGLATIALVVGLAGAPSAELSAGAVQPAAPVISVAPDAAAVATVERYRTSRDTARPVLADATVAAVAAHRREGALATQEKAIRAKQKAIVAQRKAAAAKRKKLIAKLGYTPGTKDPRSIAKQILANKYGYGPGQYSCFNNIIMRESMWDINATNASSGAYGIPQALPGSKMASVASDWRTNPATQITWAIGYMKDRYGSPCGAWGFKSSHGWY